MCLPPSKVAYCAVFLGGPAHYSPIEVGSVEINRSHHCLRARVPKPQLQYLVLSGSTSTYPDLRIQEYDQGRFDRPKHGRVRILGWKGAGSSITGQPVRHHMSNEDDFSCLGMWSAYEHLRITSVMGDSERENLGKLPITKEMTKYPTLNVRHCS